MFKSINFKKITSISFLAILMAGNLLTQPAISGNYRNNRRNYNRHRNNNNYRHNNNHRNNNSSQNNNSHRRQQNSRGHQQQNALVPTATFEGKVNYVVTGGTLRSRSNNSNACSLKSTSSGLLSGIPSNATIEKAYLYWAGSGSTVDSTVNFNGTSVAADRTYKETTSSLRFFQGVKDVTNVVSSNGNGEYTFSGLNVDRSHSYCNTETVLSGWSLIVIFKDPSITKLNTIELYEGFEGSVGETKNYTLDGIKVSRSPEAKFSMLLWEGDSTLGSTSNRREAFLFNNNILGDRYNPSNNQFNSSINTLGSTNIYGVDADTFNVSDYVSEGDTSITGSISTDRDLVIQGAAVVMVSDDLAVAGGDDGGSGSNGGSSNNSPVAEDDTVTNPYGTTKINVYVLDNDNDPDQGDTLTVTSVDNPSRGRAVIKNNSIEYTSPSPDFEGEVSFEYTVEDSAGNTDSATIYVTVLENQDPNAEADVATTPYGNNVTIDVLNNDSDPEGDTLTIVDNITTQNGGTVTVNNDISTLGTNNGNVVYTPKAGFEGPDSFTYTVRDIKGNEAEATVNVTVEPNGAPDAEDDRATTYSKQSKTIPVLANDSDPEDHEISIQSIATLPTNGTATIEQGQVVYTPNPDFPSGTDSFTYTIVDSEGKQDSATVNVTVSPIVYAD